MSNDPIHQVYALAALVRDGELSPEQREHLVTLLHLIDGGGRGATGR